MLLTYSDSDYAADVDKRRSTSGMVITYNGSAVMWFSKLQTVTACSTTEAEYISAAQATKEGLWLRKLEDLPVNLFWTTRDLRRKGDRRHTVPVRTDTGELRILRQQAAECSEHCGPDSRLRYQQQRAHANGLHG